MLEAKALKVAYGLAPGCSIAIRTGEFLGIVGPNGSGKSTLVRALCRALPLAAGAVLMEGESIWRMAPSRLARRLAVVPQETHIGFDFTVEEVVAMGRHPFVGRFATETDEDRDAIAWAMNQAGVSHLQHRSITRLSGGERQRVVVARALAQQPHILLLDEPTSHLDIAHQTGLLDLVWELNRQCALTVAAVLHDLNLAAQYCDRLVLMHEGRPVADGPPAEVLTVERIREVYGAEVLVMSHPTIGCPHVVTLRGRGAQA